MKNGFDPNLTDFDEPLESWQSPESRARNDAWRGNAAAEARGITRTGLPEGPASPLSPGMVDQLVRVAFHHIAQAMGMHSVLRELTNHRRQLAELQSWKARCEAESTVGSIAEREFSSELEELERDNADTTTNDSSVLDSFDFNLLYDGWE